MIWFFSKIISTLYQNRGPIRNQHVKFSTQTYQNLHKPNFLTQCDERTYDDESKIFAEAWAIPRPNLLCRLSSRDCVEPLNIRFVYVRTEGDTHTSVESPI